MAGGLFDPLGTDRAARPVSRVSAPTALAGFAVVALALLIALAYLRDDGDRGHTVAIAPIEHVAAPPKPAVPPPAPLPAPPAAEPAASSALPPVRDDQEVEVQNGVRIVRPRHSRSEPGGQTLSVPGAAPPASTTGR